MTQKLLSIVAFVLFSISLSAQGSLLYSGVYTSSDICTTYCMGNMQKSNVTPFVFNISIYERSLVLGKSSFPYMGTRTVNGLQARFYGTDALHYVVFSDYSMYSETVLSIMGMTSVAQTVYFKGNLLQGSSGGYSGGGQYSQGSGNGQRQRQKVKCSLCNGWGTYLKEYASRYSGTKPDKWCDQCGHYDYAHYHKTCASCQGKGYVYR